MKPANAQAKALDLDRGQVSLPKAPAAGPASDPQRPSCAPAAPRSPRVVPSDSAPVAPRNGDTFDAQPAAARGPGPGRRFALGWPQYLAQGALRPFMEAGAPKLIEHAPPRFDRKSRIAVVGGGPGGVAAAEFLKEYGGYENVQILEAGPEIGGRVQSFNVLDEKGEPLRGRDGKVLTYEYGAGLAMSGYRELELLLGRSDIKLQHPVASAIMSKAKRGQIPTVTPGDVAKLAFEVPHFLYKSMTDWRAAHRPGYQDMNEELSRPASESIGAVAPTLLRLSKLIGTAWGYDYPEDTPTATLLKYIRPRQFIGSDLVTFPQGFQKLFKDVAASHDVVFDCRVLSAKRDGDELVLRTRNAKDGSEAEHRFDKLIWTAPLHHAPDVLETLDPALKTSMKQSLTSVDYRAYVCRIDGLPKGYGAFYLPENLDKAGRDRPVFMYNPHPDEANVTMAYVIADRKTPDDVVKRNIEEDVAAIGGQLREVIDGKSWDYFPHARPNQLDVFEQIERNQGKSGVYLAGAGMEFDTTNDTVRASGVVVNRYFLKSAPRQRPIGLLEAFAHRDMGR